MTAVEQPAETPDIRGAFWFAALGVTAFLMLGLALLAFDVLPFRSGPFCVIMVTALLTNLVLANLGTEWRPSMAGVLFYEGGHALAYAAVFHFLGGPWLGNLLVVYGFLVIHSMMLRPGASAFLTANVCACCYAAFAWFETELQLAIVPAGQRVAMIGQQAALVGFGILALNYLALYAQRYGRQLREFAAQLEARIGDVREARGEAALLNRHLERDAVDAGAAFRLAAFGVSSFLMLAVVVRAFDALSFRLGPVCLILMATLLFNIVLLTVASRWRPSMASVLLYEVGHALAYTAVFHFLGGFQFANLLIVYGFLVIHSMMLRPGSSALFTANLCACCYAVFVWIETQIEWAVATAGQDPWTVGELAAAVGFGMVALNYLAFYAQRYGRQLHEFAGRLEATVGDLRRTNAELAVAKRRVEQSEEYFRALIEHGSDLVWIVNTKGQLQYASPSHAQVLGYPPEGLIGRQVCEFIHPDDRDPMHEVFRYALGHPGTVLRAEFRFRHANGSWRLLESVQRSCLDDPVVAGAVINLRDVTERREVEQRIAAYTEELEARRRDMATFIYTVTHDLRNPVNAILLTADQLRERAESGLSDADRDGLARIIQLADGVDRMVLDLLELVKITSKPEDFGWVDLHDVVARSLESLAPQIAARGARVEVGALDRVWGQAQGLGHVVGNLLSNAVKYVPLGAGEIEVWSRKENGCVVLSVRDNGIGIPAAYHERIFKIFGRVPPQAQGAKGESIGATGVGASPTGTSSSWAATNGQSIGGTGVGLTIVKRIAEKHAGWVTVQSEPGTGSCFSVYLPARTDDSVGVVASSVPDRACGNGTTVMTDSGADRRESSATDLRESPATEPRESSATDCQESRAPDPRKSSATTGRESSAAAPRTSCATDPREPPATDARESVATAVPVHRPERADPLASSTDAPPVPDPRDGGACDQAGASEPNEPGERSSANGTRSPADGPAAPCEGRP